MLASVIDEDGFLVVVEVDDMGEIIDEFLVCPTQETLIGPVVDWQNPWEGTIRYPTEPS